MKYRDTLWVALCAALNADAGEWISDARARGLSWRDIAEHCAEIGVPVSHEYLRTQAKARRLPHKEKVA